MGSRAGVIYSRLFRYTQHTAGFTTLGFSPPKTGPADHQNITECPVDQQNITECPADHQDINECPTDHQNITECPADHQNIT